MAALGGLEGLDAEHQSNLRWFAERRGVQQGFPERLDSGDMLVNSYKGIYKPHGYKYALSIRVMLDSPYEDGRFFPLGDEGWVFAYHQETNPKSPKNSEQFWTNQSLSLCQDNSVPLGILRQIETVQKGKSLYEIMGLGVVVSKFDKYFVISDFASSKAMSSEEIVHELFLAEAESLLDEEKSKLEVVPETRKVAVFDGYHDKVRVLAEITRRRGQGIFRKTLLQAYAGSCCISGCSDLAVLDAAHIIPYSETVSNEISNGLVLRTDLHALFDEDLLGIEPSSMSVFLSDSITDSDYLKLIGMKIRIPSEESLQPSPTYLNRRWLDFKGRSQKS
jgi:hypothetical protein